MPGRKHFTILMMLCYSVHGTNKPLWLWQSLGMNTFNSACHCSHQADIDNGFCVASDPVWAENHRGACKGQDAQEVWALVVFLEEEGHGRQSGRQANHHRVRASSSVTYTWTWTVGQLMDTIYWKSTYMCLFTSLDPDFLQANSKQSPEEPQTEASCSVSIPTTVKWVTTYTHSMVATYCTLWWKCVAMFCTLGPLSMICPAMRRRVLKKLRFPVWVDKPAYQQRPWPQHSASARCTENPFVSPLNRSWVLHTQAKTHLSPPSTLCAIDIGYRLKIMCWNMGSQDHKHSSLSCTYWLQMLVPTSWLCKWAQTIVVVLYRSGWTFVRGPTRLCSVWPLSTRAHVAVRLPSTFGTGMTVLSSPILTAPSPSKCLCMWHCLI